MPLLMTNADRRSLESRSPSTWTSVRKKSKISRKSFLFRVWALVATPKNSRKVLQNLLEDDLAGEENLIIWHDVINNSISAHESNRYRKLEVEELVPILEKYASRIQALVYCHRKRTSNIYQDLLDTNIRVLSIETDLLSKRKQKDTRYQQDLKAVHQSFDLEIKNLELVLKYEDNLQEILTRSHPKRPSKRARTAKKNALLAAGHPTPEPTVVEVNPVPKASTSSPVPSAVSELACSVEALRL